MLLLLLIHLQHSAVVTVVGLRVLLQKGKAKKRVMEIFKELIVQTKLDTRNVFKMGPHFAS